MNGRPPGDDNGDRLARARRAFETHMGRPWEPRVGESDPAELEAFRAINLERTYGDSWARSGLDLRTKALLTLAILAVQRAEPQFKEHVRAAEHVGVGRDEIVELLIHLGAYAGASVASMACAAAQEVWQQLDGPREP